MFEAKLKALSSRRGEFVGIAAFTIGGGLSALCLLLLASNRVPGIRTSEVSPAILAIQLYVLGLTVGKLGMDSTVFALVSADRSLSFNEFGVFRPLFVAIVAIFFLLAALLLEAQVALALSIALVADTMATITYAELNARRRFIASASSSLFNYPLFIATWALSSLIFSVSYGEAMFIFAACSVVRLAWLLYQKRQGANGSQLATIDEQGWTAAQAVLNLGLFRVDQLILAGALFGGSLTTLDDSGLNRYTFLAKVAEACIALALALGTVTFQQTFLTPPATGVQNRAAVRRATQNALALGIVSAMVFFAAKEIYRGPDIRCLDALPFILQAPLAYLANLMTFSIQRSERYPFLIKVLFSSLLVGVFVSAVSVRSLGAQFLAWVIAGQLSIFVLLAMVHEWGPPKRVYASDR